MKTYLKIILLGIITAVFFSSFIYFDYFHLTNKLINTLFGLLALGLFLYIPKKSIPIAGFFIGLFWFYWIGYSFQYQDVGYMTPFITFAFGIIYLLFFLPLYFTDKPYMRALLLFGLSFIEPFDWNWLQINLLFVDSYIGIYKYQLAFVLSALSLVTLFPKKLRFFPLLLLLGAINYGYPQQSLAPLKIKLVQTEIKQEDKWTREALYPTLKMIHTEIEKAIRNKYDVIVFPESVFPMYLNLHQDILQSIKKSSKKITIIVGALLREKNQNYNVTYMFQDGAYVIAKKLVLVPFGEYIPLPKFAQTWINNTFFKGESDFTTAKQPTDFIIKGIKFRNAICYEATCSELYKGKIHYMIASSNNAWFAPSIEPTLQKLLMRYYARKNGVTIYHSANYKGSGIVE